MIVLRQEMVDKLGDMMKGFLHQVLMVLKEFLPTYHHSKIWQKYSHPQSQEHQYQSQKETH